MTWALGAVTGVWLSALGAAALPTMEEGIAACSGRPAACLTQQAALWQAVAALEQQVGGAEAIERALVGPEVPRIQRAARARDEASCTKGVGDACYRAGAPSGAPPDDERWRGPHLTDTDLSWLTRGCTLGHAPSCARLTLARHTGQAPAADDGIDARLCSYGLGAACVFAPLPQAHADRAPLARLRLACARGSGEACGVVGRALRAMDLNDAAGRAQLERGCVLGSLSSCMEIEQAEPAPDAIDPLTRAWRDAYFVEAQRNDDAALLTRFIDTGDPFGASSPPTKACDGGDPFVCWAMGEPPESAHAELCRRGVGAACVAVAERSRGRARRDAHRALCTDRRRAESCVQAGTHNPIEPDVPLLERGCELGSAKGCVRAAAARQGAKRRALFQRACALGDTASCRAAQRDALVARAEGAEREASAARDELQQHCRAGDDEACGALGALAQRVSGDVRVAFARTLLEGCVRKRVGCAHAEAVVAAGSVTVEPGVAIALATAPRTRTPLESAAAARMLASALARGVMWFEQPLLAGEKLADAAAGLRKLAVRGSGCATDACRAQHAHTCDEWGYDDVAACDAALERAEPVTTLTSADAEQTAAALEREACALRAFAASERGAALCRVVGP
jgi:hypothetical protein